MQKVREVVSLALDERNKVQIPVRQALAKLEISGVEIRKEFFYLILDEINVKKVELKKGEKIAVKLDTKITSELEREGYLREVTRKIQDLRKKAGLQKKDRIKLFINSKYNLKGFEKEIKEKCGASKVVFGELKNVKNRIKERIKDHEFEVGF